MKSMSFLVSLLLGFSVAAADAPPLSESAPEADGLIAQLSSDDWAQREAAQERLVRLGAAAREALHRAARESDDPEIRARAETALAQIAENEVTGPSVITIQGDDLTLSDIARLLSEQARATIELFPPDAPEAQRMRRFTLDIDHASFWDAVRQIHQVTGYSVQQWDHSGVKLAQGGGPMEQGGVVSGAFVLTAVRVTRSRSIELSAGQNAHEDFQVHLIGRAEPKIRLLRVLHAPRLSEAKDENGRSLLPAAPMHVPGSAFGSAGMWNLNARLESPPDVGQRIAVLRGSIDVQIQTRAEPLEIADIRTARNVSKVINGVRITVNQLMQAGDTWRLSLTLRPEGAPNEQWQLIQHSTPTADLTLLDENGDVFARGGYSSSGSPEQIDVNVDFWAKNWRGVRRTTEPARLVWMIPTAAREMTIPFEFRDLPIP